MKTFRIYLLCMLGMLCSASAWAYDFAVDGIYYNVTSLENLEVEVTKGDWTKDSPITQITYRGDMVIPETVTFKGRVFKVTGIGAGAFYRCSKLTSIDFGHVRTIKGGQQNPLGAFCGCTSLTTLDFKNVQTVGERAFLGCKALTTVDFKNVHLLEDLAFYECTSLKKLDFKNVQSIGLGAFRGCADLTSIDLKNVQTINDRAFYQCTSLTCIDFKNVQTIGQQAFNGCKALNTLYFRNVKEVKWHAFAYCPNLTTIDFGNMKFIPNKAHDGLDLRHLVHLNMGCVECFEDDVFKDCEALKTVQTEWEEPLEIEPNTFNNKAFVNATLKVPAGTKGAYQSAPGWKNFFTIEEVGEEK